MKKILPILVLLVAVAAMSSCTSYNKTMREPNTRVELYKADFTLSNQVSAEAKTTRIIGIDWERLLGGKTGNVSQPELGPPLPSLAMLPVVGTLVADLTANYALWEIMEKNPGYDVIFYPQYTTKVSRPIIGIGFLMKTTTVTAKCRLGKLN